MWTGVEKKQTPGLVARSLPPGHDRIEGKNMVRIPDGVFCDNPPVTLRFRPTTNSVADSNGTTDAAYTLHYFAMRGRSEVKTFPAAHLTGA